MFGQSKFIVRGIVLMFALLIYGTASADSNVHSDVDKNVDGVLPASIQDSSSALINNLEYSSHSEMEEVMVIGRKEALPSDTLIDKAIRFHSKVEYFPGLTQPLRLAGTERFSLHSDNNESRFVQVFRVRFGG